MIKFNIRLRDLRKSRGLSQQKLADYTKVSKSSINMYERGEREPGLETVEVFADFFNVDIGYIIGTSNVPNKALVTDCNSNKEGEQIKKFDIHARRKELNLTLEDIGNYVGVVKSTVKKWETGHIKNMRRDKITLLAEILQVTPLIIMGYEDKTCITQQTEENVKVLSFGKVLKELRLEKGISQSELASDLGMTKSAICMYELCQRMPRADSTLKQIAEYFGVSLDYLLGLSEDRFAENSMQQTNEEMADLYFRMRKNEKLTEGIKILCELPPDQLDAALLVLKAFQK